MRPLAQHAASHPHRVACSRATRLYKRLAGPVYVSGEGYRARRCPTMLTRGRVPNGGVRYVGGGAWHTPDSDQKQAAPWPPAGRPADTPLADENASVGARATQSICFPAWAGTPGSAARCRRLPWRWCVEAGRGRSFSPPTHRDFGILPTFSQSSIIIMLISRAYYSPW